MRPISDIGAAVIGSGFIGTVHIEALRRLGVRVHGLLEVSPEHGAKRAAELGLPGAYADMDEMLADERVEVVHVTSPNALHFPQVVRIIAAGKNVVCEKPLATTSAESAELVRLAAEAGVVNAVNFNIRFYPLNQHLRPARGATARWARSAWSPATTSRTGSSSTRTGTGGSTRPRAACCGPWATSARTGSTS